MANDVLTDNANIYSTFVELLSTAPQLSDTSVVYGEENAERQDFPLPMVVIYPDTIRYDANVQGYRQSLDPNYLAVWSRKEFFKLELWAADTAIDASEVNHANKVHELESKVLQALYYRRAQGYTFIPTDSRWALFEGADLRYGRGMVMTVMLDIPVLYNTPEFATVEEAPVTVEIVD